MWATNCLKRRRLRLRAKCSLGGTFTYDVRTQGGLNVTILLIGCVSVTVTGGSNIAEKTADVKFEWLLEPRRRVIHPNDRLNTTTAGLTDHKSGKGWKTLLSDKATCKMIFKFVKCSNPSIVLQHAESLSC